MLKVIIFNQKIKLLDYENYTFVDLPFLTQLCTSVDLTKVNLIN